MLGRLRLYSGLVLFTYLVGHLANHALGVISLEAMNAGLRFTVAPWRTVPGTLLLGGAALVHVTVVLRALYLRQTLRMPSWQRAQTLLGLLIPFGLIGHVLGTRGMHEAFGVHGSYLTELAALWLLLPGFGVLQAVLLVVAWLHACIGLHAWLRLKPWYAAHERLAFALALLWPALALAGYVSGGISSSIPARSWKIPHSSARSSGTAPCRFSTQTLHCRAASSTASGQLAKRCGGHATGPGGHKRKR